MISLGTGWPNSLHHCVDQSKDYQFDMIGHAETHHMHAGHAIDALWTRTVRAPALCPRDRHIHLVLQSLFVAFFVSSMPLCPRAPRELTGNPSKPHAWPPGTSRAPWQDARMAISPCRLVSRVRAAPAFISRARAPQSSAASPRSPLPPRPPAPSSKSGNPATLSSP